MVTLGQRNVGTWHITRYNKIHEVHTMLGTVQWISVWKKKEQIFWHQFCLQNMLTHIAFTYTNNDNMHQFYSQPLWVWSSFPCNLLFNISVTCRVRQSCDLDRACRLLGDRPITKVMLTQLSVRIWTFLCLICDEFCQEDDLRLFVCFMFIWVFVYEISINQDIVRGKIFTILQ